MTEPPNHQRPSPPRAARLADALRANLKRRKSQARGRAAQADEAAPDEAPPPAEIAEDNA